jgi:hypothetical protein
MFRLILRYCRDYSEVYLLYRCPHVLYSMLAIRLAPAANLVFHLRLIGFLLNIETASKISN